VPDELPASPYSRVVRVRRTGSTNADVARALRDDPVGATASWPHLAVLVADHQAGGRGRAGRTWATPPGTSLTASVVLRPTVPLGGWSWLGLLGGLAVARAVRARTGLATGVKWPNDVVVRDADDGVVPGWGRERKVAGVLAELVHARAVPDRPAPPPVAVLGLGVNVEQAADGLPVPWATSLAACGVAGPGRDLNALLSAVGVELIALLASWEAAGGDAERSGLAAAVDGACTTLGRDVRVHLPGGDELVGRARRLADDGALVLALAGGSEVRVTVGDVDHIRTVTD
jgi:BirA family transcriptional regulator, biotin operon repressor / biotin---[acetyl-CoA-carboxylase] ligase